MHLVHPVSRDTATIVMSELSLQPSLENDSECQKVGSVVLVWTAKSQDTDTD